MTLFDNDPKNRWLFCLTHPDDEISICAWMRRLALAGAEVWAGWSVSDEVRESEARAVMLRLGVPQENLRFFRFPDFRACEHLHEMTDAWAEVIRESSPDRIALGAFECGHIDHDSTNLAVRSALDRLGLSMPMLEIPFYHTYADRPPVINRFADPAGEEVLHLTSEEWGLKREVSRCYPSQRIAGLLRWYTAYGWLCLRPSFLCRTERMREQTHFDYQTPNLPAHLRARVIGTPQWARWLEAQRMKISA